MVKQSLVTHIGVLTSGGDSPGMNAAIRSIVRSSIQFGLKVSGIHYGFEGLINGEVESLNLRSVSHIISQGGTMLKSSRSELFRTEEGRHTAHKTLEKRGINGLIVIGGDGSMKGAYIFQQEYNVPVIGLPGTIDNDIFGTDYTIGFDTAVNVATECIDKIRDTANSHDRIFLVEVMGRDSGHIALHTAVACGAIAVLMPEAPLTMDQLMQRLDILKKQKKSSSIIIVAEGNPTGDAYEVAQKINGLNSAYETRVTVLGHIQRGGSPTVSDRILASELGVFAVESLINGKCGMMAGKIKNELTLTPIEKATNLHAGHNESLHRIAGILSS